MPGVPGVTAGLERKGLLLRDKGGPGVELQHTKSDKVRQKKLLLSGPSEEFPDIAKQIEGFDIESARSTAIVVLNQARADNVSVFDLLNSLKSLTDVQLSQVVAQILNTYREKISLLGYRVAPLVNTYESRNILV